MARTRKTLRLTVAYSASGATVQSHEFVDAAPVLSDPKPKPGTDAHWVTVEGARFARRLPDPSMGAELFSPDGTVQRVAPEAGRTITLDLPWPEGARQVVFRAPSPQNGRSRARTKSLGGDWRDIGRFRPPAAPPRPLARPLQFPATPLFAGASAKALTLVFLAEGFRGDELPRYRQVVDAFVARLRATAPFDRMIGALAAVRVDSLSPDSGIDDPASGRRVNTWLDGRFGEGALRRLIQVDQRKAVEAATAAAGRGRASVGLVVANTTEYGGSGGQVAVFSCDPAAADIALHELGHTLFGLADEYSDAGSSQGEPSEPNVTRKPAAGSGWGAADLQRLKWKGLLTPGLTVPTHVNGDCSQASNAAGPAGVGVFEGGKYRHCGVFRPAATCKMRIVTAPFCPVCQAVIETKLKTFL